ncbi:NAD(P)-binding protein [Massilia genomosp. 1]|uniref:FAD-dependent oxidoreductase n=1 Tax=Massilia genomosp. 1 TaxID=2609280 RepID=A0ABX0MPA8_9BURK|nr:NAD(P)/FAD-dependent oxidoreductase [Massilia genomosp. 1]NHZ64196.1 FAD-dependent oxidoreductase [Massilia genomosp. 1]
MDRRTFLALAGGAGAAAASAGLFRQWLEMTPAVHYPGRAEGHFLREGGKLPAPGQVIETDIVILGSGIAGLAAAWKLGREGQRKVLMIDGPQPFGNAAGGHFGELAYPTGGHYLPLPSPESVHVREILFDLGVIARDPYGDKPCYDERVILHGPAERVLFNGRWQEGLIPTDGVSAQERAEHARFFAEVERLRTLRGSDARRAFVFPSVSSSRDPVFDALDRITFKAWLDQQGYRSPTLHWYLNYCCRDDYGTRYDKVSAWAGLHYFASRGGQAANAGNGAWLTWPGGMQAVADKLAAASGVRRRPGTAFSLKRSGAGVEALCFTLDGGVARSYLVRARKAICAMPLYVAARVVEDIGAYGFDVKRHTPSYAPWLVANFLMKDFPRELPHAPLAWDNVVCQEPGLGYVVSTHQDIRVTPPGKTVFSAYVALSDRTPAAARTWMMSASGADLVALAGADLASAYGWKFAACVERVEITLRGHAMAAPLPGFRSNAGLAALREADGPIVFAHADLSGFSVFEEAAWWGVQAALKVLK